MHISSIYSLSVQLHHCSSNSGSHFYCPNNFSSLPRVQLEFCPCLPVPAKISKNSSPQSLRSSQYGTSQAFYLPSLVAQSVKNLPAVQETWVRFLGWEDSPGEGNGNPLQCSLLKNPTDRGASWTTVHGVAKESDTTQRLNNKLFCLILRNLYEVDSFSDQN